MADKEAWPELRLDAFMERAVSHYYGTRDPFTDFTTAPEISQVFGELIGAWVAVTWTQLGRPDPFLLIEAGPGRGTLMQDALRVIAKSAPRCAAAAEVHFIETSPVLRAKQAERVPGAQWHNRIEDAPAGPAIVIANEFLDTLPLRQFERTPDGWAERHVHDGAFVLRATDLPEAPPPGDGSVFEICEPARAWVAALSARLARDGGAALLIDYGYGTRAMGDTLQAFRGAKPADPLADPGESDVTAHVDFETCAAIARRAGLAAWGVVTQAEFLLRLGLRARVARLCAENIAKADAVRAAADRLISETQMGTLFKVMALTQSGAAAPAGFE